MTQALTAFEVDQRRWLAGAIDEVTVAAKSLTPSEWAESRRYLPPALTALPGYYSFDVTPYLREILDCFHAASPISEVTAQKGAQLGFTVGVLENVVGYEIDHIKTAPMMMVTADAELAKLRLESNIVPMLQHSGLEHLIKSADEKNARKTGRTDKKIEWAGGGYLVPFGAQNANKLRSLSIQVLLNDEIDGWPYLVGKDGDPLKLVRDRTAAYEGSRKILNISTPTIVGQSKISQLFLQGDQRYFYVSCLSCGTPQRLRWERFNRETGERTGIVWETENGRLVHDSVRYLCKVPGCGHAHVNDDKTRLLAQGEWRPTAKPSNPRHRSYHLSALYSPVGMQTWAGCVEKWLEAWDPEQGRSRDNAALQVFYNNVLGEPFQIRGEKVRFEAVSGHRRHDYLFGQVPNAFAKEVCGSPILLVTCAVDVHGDNLAVAVFGWARDRRAFLLDYRRLAGDTEQLDDAATWGELRKLIEDPELYVADDGKRYKIQLTLIDSGYRADHVYRFCESYGSGVFPSKGLPAPMKGARLKEWSNIETSMGTTAYGITVDLYKDRWSAALKREWKGIGEQPTGHFNAPGNATDEQLKELTVEIRREKIEAGTRKRIGHEWHRPSGSNNELWDLLVYNNAALDIVAQDVCVAQLELEAVNWLEFFDLIERERSYFEAA